MRKHPLIALTAFTALTASAVAGASTGTFESNSVLTGASADVASAPATTARTTASPVALVTGRTVSGGRNLAVMHDLRHPSRLLLSARTGLPVIRRAPRHVAVTATVWVPPATIPPTTTPPTPTPSVVTTTTSAPSIPAGGVWYELRVCESGDNYAEDTGNGYYGAYQFSLATWYGLGLSGLPSEASPAVQDAAAQKLQAEAGWGQWPSCSAELGL